MGKLKAGSAKLCITPPQALLNEAIFQEHAFGGVHDDLHVRALVIDNGERRMAFLTFDAPDMNCTEEIYSGIEEKYHIKRQNICLASTHAHSAPMYFLNRTPHPSDPLMEQMFAPGGEALQLANDYARYIIRKAVEVTGKAIEDMRPARYGFTQGKSYINVCRDEEFENGLYGMGADFGGPSDKTLCVLKFEDMEGKKIAVLANYAVHGTACMGKKDKDGKATLISADLPGAISTYVEKRFEEDGTVCVWTSGAAGNQDPMFPSEYYTLKHDTTAEKNIDLGYAQWALCAHLGQKQGVDIIRLVNSMDHMKDHMKISVVQKDVLLPARRLEPGPWSSEGMRGDRAYQGTEIPTDPLTLKLKLVTFDDIAFLGMNAEIVTEIGMRLKAASPLKNTIIVEHTGERIHYLTDKDGDRRHTHTYFATRAKGGLAEEYIMAAMLQMFNERFAE